MAPSSAGALRDRDSGHWAEGHAHGGGKSRLCFWRDRDTDVSGFGHGPRNLVARYGEGSRRAREGMGHERVAFGGRR